MLLRAKHVLYKNHYRKVQGHHPLPMVVAVNKRVPTSVFFGWATLIGLAGLFLNTCIFLVDTPFTSTISIAGDLAYAGLVIYHVLRVAYLVFETRGAGHYSLSVWRCIDVYLAHQLSQFAISSVLWKFSASSRTYDAFTHTGDVGVLYAAYDLLIYTAWLFNGAGISDNTPLNEATRAISGLQSVWHGIVLLLVVSALFAVVLGHRDERVSQEPSEAVLDEYENSVKKKYTLS